MSEVRALTLTQPWASLIALGHKQMETRSWPTHWRGPLLVHAGRTLPLRPNERMTLGPLGEWSVERDAGGLLLRGPIEWPYRLPLGAFVATANLFQVRSTSSGEHGPAAVERSLGDHTPGRWAWSLSCVQALRDPLPATGRLGLWKPTDDQLAAVHARVPNPGWLT